jgi:hypothetical protein
MYINIILKHSPLAFQRTRSIIAQASLCLDKRTFSAKQWSAHAPLSPLLGPRWIDGILLPLRVYQTSDTQKGRGQDYMEDGP